MHLYLSPGLITLSLEGSGHDLWRSYKASSKEPSLSSPEPRAVEFGIDWTVETFESFFPLGGGHLNPGLNLRELLTEQERAIL